jgi:hypothetical protein
VAEAGKSGLFDVLSAATGRPLLPPVRFGRAAGAGCPGELGGSNYAPVAYSPRARAAYISGISYCTRDHAAGRAAAARHRSGQPDLGGDATPAGPARGTFSAVSTITGRLLWQRALPSPMLGGALATGGGLVFAGSAAGVLYAFDPRGQVVWRHRFAAGFGSAPVSYAIGGRQYLAVVSGGAAISAINQLGPVGGRLVVFSLR